MAKTQKEKMPTAKGIACIIAATVGAIFFCWQICINLTTIDQESLRSSNDLLKLSIAEVSFMENTALAADVVGLLICFALLVYGFSGWVTVEVKRPARGNTRQKASPSAPSESYDYSDEEF